LFRIAHNRCLDLLRRRGFREEAEAEATLKQPPPVVEPDEPDGGPASPRAFERLVLTLPPKERACVLLKDVFEYSLEEIADLVDSTVGGVKAALNRGRSKLARRSGDVGSPRMKTADDIRLLQLYVDRFNERDWDGLRELIAADARLVVADRFAGRVGDSPYFRNYSGSAGSWRMAVGEVDGDAAVIVLRRAGDGWTPAAVVRIDLSDGRITRIADYSHCPWVVPAATSLALDESA
jgi:RNA polymerase sigma-70 factor (ECF subfamily)